MKNAPDFHSTISMRMWSTSRSNKLNPSLIATTPKFGIVIMRISQDIARLRRQMRQQVVSHFYVGSVGCGKLGCQWYPDCPHCHSQMQFPSIPPAVPARFRPACFSIYRSMRNLAFFFMFLVPDSAASSQHCRVESCCASVVNPRFKHHYKMATEIANQGRQTLRQNFQSSLEGVAARSLCIFSKQNTELLSHQIILMKKLVQSISGVESTNDHNDESFKNEAIRIGLISATLWPGRLRW